MTSTTKCPICGNKAEYMSFYEEIGKVEEHINCNRCGYIMNMYMVIIMYE